MCVCVCGWVCVWVCGGADFSKLEQIGTHGGGGSERRYFYSQIVI